MRLWSSWTASKTNPRLQVLYTYLLYLDELYCLIASKSYGFKSKVTTVPTGSFDVSVRGDADSEFGENYDESPGYYIPEKKFTYRDFVKRIIGK